MTDTSQLKHTDTHWSVQEFPDGSFSIVGAVDLNEHDQPHARVICEFPYGGEPQEQADAARIIACVNACEGMADPAAEIALLRSHSCLRTICEALGWQGGTIHQAVAEIQRLREFNTAPSRTDNPVAASMGMPK